MLQVRCPIKRMPWYHHRLLVNTGLLSDQQSWWWHKPVGSIADRLQYRELVPINTPQHLQWKAVRVPAENPVTLLCCQADHCNAAISRQTKYATAPRQTCMYWWQHKLLHSTYKQ